MLSLFEDAIDEDLDGFDVGYASEEDRHHGCSTNMDSLCYFQQPHVMKKARRTRHSVGRNKLVDESRITNLVYLPFIAKESLRLYPRTHSAS
ncbi:hypothetical protein H5410_024487 [Solanum commersonii]|uniref:Uncharacterized protein n=1 Tax=Solanum commersonii TaxID=4109 RepID=A0A9J5ZM56_SOLCO|nr:hypothetical protein H5410_024487 [Solanum commersonii]